VAACLRNLQPRKNVKQGYDRRQRDFSVGPRRGQRVFAVGALLSHSLRPLRRDQFSRDESLSLRGTLPRERRTRHRGSSKGVKGRISESKFVNTFFLKKPVEIASAAEISATTNTRKNEEFSERINCKFISDSACISHRNSNYESC